MYNSNYPWVTTLLGSNTVVVKSTMFILKNHFPVIKLVFSVIKGTCNTVMGLIIRTIQLFEHLPFPGKKINYCSQTNTHFRNYYSNIRTPTPCRTRTGVAERLLAFDSLRGATARVTKRLLAYYRRFWTSTKLVQPIPDIYYTPTLTAELERGLPSMY